jgi:hypothetical protein
VKIEEILLLYNAVWFVYDALRNRVSYLTISYVVKLYKLLARDRNSCVTFVAGSGTEITIYTSLFVGHHSVKRLTMPNNMIVSRCNVDGCQSVDAGSLVSAAMRLRMIGSCVM